MSVPLDTTQLVMAVCVQFAMPFSCSVILADVATVFLATCNNTCYEDADVYSG